MKKPDSLPAPTLIVAVTVCAGVNRRNGVIKEIGKVGVGAIRRERYC